MDKRKLTLTIKDFSGGLNSLFDPSEIQPNEFSSIINLFVDKKGKIRKRGQFDLKGRLETGSYVLQGCGLYSFHTDWKYSTSFGAASASAESWIAVATASNVWLMSKTASTWEKLYTASNTTADGFGLYYVGDALRIYDIGWTASNTVKRWGYIDRDMFNYVSSFYARSVCTWYLDDALCYSPSGGTFGVSSAPVSAEYVNVKLANSSASGVGWDKRWECAASFVYDDNQESLLKQLAGTVSGLNSASSASISVTVGVTGSWNPRITDINVYFREIDTDDWFLQSTVNIKDGAEKVNIYPDDINTK
jgi:hypothetical protein